MFDRQEIDLTLDRLKKAERELSEKEKSLREREMKVKLREQNLEQQFNVVVSGEVKVKGQISGNLREMKVKL